MISIISHVSPLTKVQRQLLLPVPGKVLVRSGQSVHATDVIAEANLEPEHMLLDIAHFLGVAPQSAGAYIKRTVGEQITEGSVIAEKGNFGRVVRAPAAGKIVAVSKGQVLLEFNNRPFQLLAGLSGVVTKVEAEYGATIEATGSWIQGVWGNGKLAVGGLICLAEEPEHVLEVDQIQPAQRGAVVFAGHCRDPQAFEAAAANQWRGLILGSMPANLIPQAENAPFPVIVLEGFGNLPVIPPTFKLFSSNEEREVVLNTVIYNPLTGEPPEVTIPVEAEATVASSALQRLTEGLRVRILRAANAGVVGTITALPAGLMQFPSGLRAPAAEVSTDSGKKVSVPVANIEVLG